MVSQRFVDSQTHKSVLVALGLWGVLTGRGWVVRAVEAAIVREVLAHG